MSSAQPSAISCRQLTRHYGRRIGVDSLNLDVKAGEVFGFLGPNGAGKTTAIRLLLGFLRPSAGSAQLFGRDCWKHSALIKRDVGYLPGDLRIYHWMTGHSALRISGRIRQQDLTATGRALSERFRIDLDVPVRKMSRGMRQKVGLLLALAHQPKLLVLDEPTSGLDPLMQYRLCSYLQELAEGGHTVFFSSHSLSEVEQLCDRVAIVRDGRIVADETMQALRSRARRTVTVLFTDERTASETGSPNALTICQRSGRCWEAELTGSIPDLIQWAAGQPLEDLQIGAPNLEDLFRQFYQSTEKDS